MRIGVPSESAAGERRVALVPEVVAKLVSARFEVALERGAGEAASFPDADYEEHEQASPLDIPVDLHNFKKFPVVDPPGTHKPTGADTRGQIRVESSAELPDYSGRSRPTCASRTSPTRLWST